MECEFVVQRSSGRHQFKDSADPFAKYCPK
jgi:hypothetical protein